MTLPEILTILEERVIFLTLAKNMIKNSETAEILNTNIFYIQESIQKIQEAINIASI